ncbi:hypothetical protein SYNPS1DRAFT_22975 [Syncephalis pseudoplumigaleata]|uniref:RRM domain-containing protein n=1 Tax=Syncephalis pseudoplumigaleata TaxID=1712513 RepID=A0A4P9YY25_9FUNG|nr:hypothetical protein SYNPS1DRAFT_22975 [Syncephalis pseudoplumigaleata]|eukprot:RKP24996.1 hypothetical protein SYNPS1DRAFT_22975 [Syncephalis pseudoplumigaleata]
MADELFDIYDDAFGDDDHPTTLTSAVDHAALDDPLAMVQAEASDMATAATAAAAAVAEPALASAGNHTEDDMFDDFGGLDPTSKDNELPGDKAKPVIEEKAASHAGDYQEREPAMGRESRSRQTPASAAPVSETTMALFALPGSVASMPGSSSASMSTANAAGLYIGDLTWWTSEDQLRAIAEEAGIAPADIKDVIFQEHRNNGKSKGIAFMQLNTAEAARSMKAALEAS